MQERLDQVGTAAVDGLRSGVRGQVITPADEEYERARQLYLSGFRQRPMAIVRPLDTGDVAQVVRGARDHGVELAIRSGGHSVAGHGTSDGGIVLDLASMRGIAVDPEGRTAWAEAGATAGEYTRAVGAHGLATGFGDAPTVGVGGITLGGGVGFLHRAYGLTIDNVLAAEVVTADGRTLRTNAESHPDLFWALRGGGGNFGVVTRIHYRLAEVDSVYGGMMVLPATPAIVEEFLCEAMDSPEPLSGMINVTVAPPMPIFPAAVVGKPIVMALLVYAGPADQGERALAPFRSLATPLMDAIGPIRYPQIYDGHEAPHPVAMAGETMFLDSFDRAAAEAVLDALGRSTASMKVAQFRPLGGAVARVPQGATAFPHRRRRMMVTAATLFEREEDRPEHATWASSLASSLRGDDRAAYIGFLAADGADRVRQAYGDATWERLRRVKQEYDPENLFRRNHNVPPARS